MKIDSSETVEDSLRLTLESGRATLVPIGSGSSPLHSVFEFEIDKLTHKYLESKHPELWRQDEFLPFAFDGTYQAVYNRLFAEIFDILSPVEVDSTLETSFKRRRAQENLLMFDKSSSESSSALVRERLGGNQYESRQTELKLGQQAFSDWISALFELHVMGTNSLSLPERYKDPLVSSSKGDFFAIQRYVRIRYPSVYDSAVSHLKKLSRMNNDPPTLTPEEELGRLELFHVDKAISLALNQEPVQSVQDSTHLLQAAILREHNNFWRASWVSQDTSQDKKMDEIFKRFENLLPNQYMRYLDYASSAIHDASNDRVEELSQFLEDLERSAPKTLDYIKSQLPGPERQAKEALIRSANERVQAHKKRSSLVHKITRALQTLSNPEKGAEEDESLESYLLIKKLKKDPSPTTMGNKLVKETTTFLGFDSIQGTIKSKLSDVEKAVRRETFLAFGFDHDNKYTQLNYISTQLGIRFARRAGALQQANPKLSTKTFEEIKNALQPIEYQRKIGVLRRSATLAEALQKWRRYQEESLRMLMDDPEKNGLDFLPVAKMASILKVHEDFPTYASVDKDEWKKVDGLVASLNPARWSEVESIFTPEYLRALATRLKFISIQAIRPLERWKNEEPRTWVCHALNFQMLTEFTEYLAVNQDYPGLVFDRFRLAPMEERIIQMVDKTRGGILPQWQGSLEEIWMRKALGQSKSRDALYEYDDRFARLRHTITPWIHPKASLWYSLKSARSIPRVVSKQKTRYKKRHD